MARGSNQILTGGRELSLIYQRSWEHGSLFARIINAINTLATNSSVSATGKLPPPAPIDAINVSGSAVGQNVPGVITVNSEILHLTLTHNAPIQKGIQHITEISTEPNFLQPHVLDHGASRSLFVHLPASDDNDNPHTYYVRSYAQYHGSDPCKPTTLGGLTGAIGIQMTGTSKTSLLPSTGSGTAQPSGQQGGKGLGTVLHRPQQGPKRNLSI